MDIEPVKSEETVPMVLGYATPESMQHLQDGLPYWLEGDRLVAVKGTVLPGICVRCGVECDGAIKKVFRYLPTWYLLMLIVPAGLYVLLILFLVLQRKGELTFYVCKGCRKSRGRAVMGFCAALLAGVGTIAGAGVCGLDAALGKAILLLGGTVVCVASVWAIFALPWLRTFTVTQRVVIVRGASRGFMEKLPSRG